MNWNNLRSEADLEAALEASKTRPVLLFKHSTRCSISATALSRLTRKWQESDDAKVTPFYLDLLSYRPLSNRIAELTGIRHESPQAIVLKDGKAVYAANHMEISYEDILSAQATV